jgi:hypothetical protein
MITVEKSVAPTILITYFGEDLEMFASEVVPTAVPGPGGI